MKRRIADALIRLARRLDPNSCLDWHELPHAKQPGQAFIQIDKRHLADVIRLDPLVRQAIIDRIHA